MIRKKRIACILSLVATVLILTLMGQTSYAKKKDADTIYTGIYIDELYVGGLTKDAATKAYQKYMESFGDYKLTLISDVGEYEVDLNDLNVHVAVDKAVEAAYNYGRNGSILTRYKEIRSLEEDNVVITPRKLFDHEVIEDKLTNEAWALMKTYKNASISRENGQFVVYPSETGVSLMIDRTILAMEKELNKEWVSADRKMEAVTKITQPKYVEDDFYMIDSVLGQSQTTYTSGNSSRSQNLVVGAKKVSGTIVLPGEQFSMYNTVAPFTEENGYENAGQYVNNELVDGLGGGICQVSTTLYIAVLRAELQVDARYPHSMTVSYVPKGMDAAIAGEYEDFKFTNNTKYPIYIEGYAGGGSISFAIYGHEYREENRVIDFESKVIETYEPGKEQTIYDNTLDSGVTNVTPAHTGYYVELWKNVYVNGELQDSYKVDGSQYNAQPKTTRIGTK